MGKSILFFIFNSKELGVKVREVEEEEEVMVEGGEKEEEEGEEVMVERGEGGGGR